MAWLVFATIKPSRFEKEQFAWSFASGGGGEETRGARGGVGEVEARGAVSMVKTSKTSESAPGAEEVVAAPVVTEQATREPAPAEARGGAQAARRGDGRRGRARGGGAGRERSSGEREQANGGVDERRRRRRRRDDGGVASEPAEGRNRRVRRTPSATRKSIENRSQCSTRMRQVDFHRGTHRSHEERGSGSRMARSPT